MVHEFIGKSLLITEGKIKILAVADLHLGYDQALRESGVFVPGGGAFGQTMCDLKEIFDRVERVDIVVLLGDVKHVFGTILPDERREILNLFDYLLERSKEVVVIKGNHDTILEPVAHEGGVKIKDYWVWEGYCFLHGDKAFEIIYENEIKTWVIGHAHPAIGLREKAKREIYKCFLEGKYKGKKILIVPSFFNGFVGVDICENELKLAWRFDVVKFKVYIVGTKLDVFSFGRVEEIKF